MNELEQAFEDVEKQEDEKLTEKLSQNGEAEEVIADDSELVNSTEEREADYDNKADIPRVQNELRGFAGGTDWETQLKELSEYTGKGVYGLNGLKNLPNFTEMDRLMRSGATALQAYKTANFDSIMKNEVQKERNKLRSKAHLKISRGGANANEVVVPNDVYRAFKMLEPNMSDEEIRQYYKKTYKN